MCMCMYGTRRRSYSDPCRGKRNMYVSCFRSCPLHYKSEIKESYINRPYVGKMTMITKFYSAHLKGIDSFRDVRLDWKIVLKLILKKWGVRMWSGFIWLKIGLCLLWFSVL